MQQVLPVRLPDYRMGVNGEALSRTKLLTGACDGKIPSIGLVRLLQGR